MITDPVRSSISSRPEDIPQDVWDRAALISEQRFQSKYCPHQFKFLAEDIARAIMAAKAEEREACAAMADKAMIGSLCPYVNDKPGDPTWGHTDEDICPVCRVNGHDALFKCYDSISGRLADAIRKRGEG